MTLYSVTEPTITIYQNKIRHLKLLFLAFCSGLLLPLGFAPFHLPGLAILGIAFLFVMLQSTSWKQGFIIGFFFGLGYLGLGISWLYVSIHDYGHLGIALSSLITLVTIIFFTLYFSFLGALFSALKPSSNSLHACLFFSALWCLTEYIRSTLMGGFPWLLLGSSQIDTPLKFLLPIVGVYGVSFITSLIATFFVISLQTKNLTRIKWIAISVTLLLSPLLLQHKHWTTIQDKILTVSVIQPNLSMRDKWDQTLFFKILKHYQYYFSKLMGKKNIIITPESAIPIPDNLRR